MTSKEEFDALVLRTIQAPQLGNHSALRHLFTKDKDTGSIEITPHHWKADASREYRKLLRITQ